MIRLDAYGNLGAYLLAAGWQVKPTDAPALGATAVCQSRTRTILVRRAVFDRPSLRVRRYVMPHEMWHAVHCEAIDMDTHAIVAARNINVAAALEVVADAATLAHAPSRTMRAWVRASVAWHGKVGYRYRWADVVSAEARLTVARLDAAIAAWAATKEDK